MRMLRTILIEITINYMNIKRLPLNKRYQGYDLKQIIRSDKAAIYSISSGALKEHHYEVVKIRIEKITETIQNSSFSHFERYPRSEDWGMYGWTYKTLLDTKNKFMSLNPLN